MQTGIRRVPMMCGVCLLGLQVCARPATAQQVQGSGRPGEVAVWTGASTIGGDLRLVWDLRQHRLGIGTPMPLDQFHLTGNLRLPITTARNGVATGGVIKLGSNRFLHNYGPTDAGNTFLGENAGNFTMGGTGIEGKWNTGLGQFSLSGNTTGAVNTAVGWTSLAANTTGSGNVAIGGQALSRNSTAKENTAVGLASLPANTIGSHNTAIGADSLFSNTTASGNTAVGAYTLYTQSFNNSNTPWESYNTAVGFQALYSNQPVFDPDLRVPSGCWNTAIGGSALSGNTTGRNNTAVGSGSLAYSTTANWNTAVGGGSLSYNSTGDENEAVGVGSLMFNETGLYNTAIGTLSLFSNSSGHHNVAVGHLAGYNNDTGNSSVFLGPGAGFYENGSNRLHIANHPLYTLIYGEFDTARVGIDNVYPTVTLDVNGEIRSRSLAAGSVCADATGVLRSCPSDTRLKKNVMSLSEGVDVLEAVQRLRAVTFNWDTSVERARTMGDQRELGMIAQEVEAVLPEAVHTAPDGYRTLDYAALSAFLVEVAKVQQAEIEGLKAKLAQLEGRLSRR